jgi:hypothetical protein
VGYKCNWNLGEEILMGGEMKSRRRNFQQTTKKKSKEISG